MRIQCPEGHSDKFTQYAIGIYSCSACGPTRKFCFNGGLPYWTDKPETRMIVCGTENK